MADVVEHETKRQRTAEDEEPAAAADDDSDEEPPEDDVELTTFASLVDAVRENAIKTIDVELPMAPSTPEQMKELADALEKNTSITWIAITQTQDEGEDDGIGDDMWAVFFAALGRGAAPNLTHLNLEGNEFGDDGAAALAACVRAGALSKLKHLQLNHNPMGDAGALALADCASAGGLPELKELNISNNSVEVAGATAAALKACIATGHFPKLNRMYVNEDPWSKALEAACKARDIVLRHY